MSKVNNINQYKMHYNSPAENWNEGLPIGNGRMGAIVFGQIMEERYQLNEDTFWSGFPRDTNNYEAVRYLNEARNLIKHHKYAEAETIIQNKMLSVNPQAYQPFADLWLRLQHDFSAHQAYSRQLHLNEAIVYSDTDFTKYKLHKEAWISEPHQVLVIRLESTNEKKLDVELGFTTPHPYEKLHNDLNSDFFCAAFNAPTHIADNYMNNHPNPVQYETGKGIRAQCYVRALSDGQIIYAESTISIIAATTITFYVSMNTSYINFETPPHQDDDILLQQNINRLNDIFKLSYEQLKQSHVQNFKAYFERVQFRLQSDAKAEEQHTSEPISERLIKYREGSSDLALEELYFHYAKYLIISASRNGTEAMNLQGIWNEHVQPPWFSDYTLNINTEMNYWPVLALGLTECVEPLHRFIEELSVTGKRTARIHYNARGWTAHHNSDIWRMATPTSGSASWAFWPLSAIWLCQHLWGFYQYEQDKKFLQEIAYPIMTEAALFAIDWLIEDECGQLTTSPSTSPENQFKFNDEVSSVATGSAMDLSLIGELFSHCISASQILDMSSEVINEIKTAQARLAKPKLTDDGVILEWSTSFKEVEMGHRHVSHLYGIYPGTSLLEAGTSYTDGAKRTLRRRIKHGGGHTGWSCAWLINLFARLNESEQAYYYLRTLLSRSTYNNLFDAHPPFQIDGNFGGVAGMLEMLVQSHDETISLLPSLPNAWPSGQLLGAHLRGGFTIDLTWTAGQLDYAVITSHSGSILRLKDAQLYRVEAMDNQLSYEQGEIFVTNKMTRYRITLN